MSNSIQETHEFSLSPANQVQDNTECHHSQLETSSDAEAPMAGRVVKQLCAEHEREELKLYCETCKMLICLYCTIRRHKAHDYNLISYVIPKHRDELKTSLKPLYQSQVYISRALSKLDSSCTAVSSHRALMEDEIQSVVGALKDKLDARMTELVTELQQVTQQQLATLAQQKERLNLTQTQLASSIKQIQEALAGHSQIELMKTKPSMIKKAQQLNTHCIISEVTNIILPPKPAFYVSPDIHVLHQQCETFGHILTHTVPD